MVPSDCAAVVGFTSEICIDANGVVGGTRRLPFGGAASSQVGNSST